MTNYFTHKLSQYRIILISVLIYLCGVIFYCLWTYNIQKKEIIAQVDQKLTQAARSIDYLIPMGYHDRAIGPDSISKIEYLEVMELLNKSAENTGVIYIYSVARCNNKIYFTSSNATNQEMLTGENLTYYWQAYSEADTAFYNAFNRNFAIYTEYTDRWGTFKTILIPRTTQLGHKYLLCADMEISFIKSELREGIWTTLLKLLYLLIIVLPFIYALFVNYRRYSSDLEEKVIQRTEMLEAEMLRRRKSEEILIQSEEKFSVAFQRMPVPMFIMDITGIIIEVNKSFQEVTGLTQNKAKGHYILSIPFFESASDFELIKNTVEKQGSVINHKMKYRNKTIINNCSYSAELIQLNDTPHILSIVFDISERTKYENELRIAKEKAEESDRLKSNFLANMSHEVRTPLNAVIGFSELLREENLKPQQRNEYIDIVTANSRNLLELINDIIDISKIEAGQLKISETDCNINILMNQLFKWIEKERIEKGKSDLKIILSLSLPEDKAFLITDEIRVRQVLVNLLTNALKFTTKGSIDFGYNVGDNELQFFVKDSGIGIPKQSLFSIFERFKQADEGASRKYGGTGLGLAISKAITELLGGTIWVDSQPGLGSTFYFTIPYKPVAQKEIKKEWSEIIQESKISFSGCTALIVEDDDSSYFYLKTILEKSGANVIHAHEGKSALEIYNAHPEISFVLMDLHLPGMTGCEIASKIRKINTEIPLIAQTADALVETRKHALSCGFNEYLTKPLNREILFEIINRYLLKKNE